MIYRFVVQNDVGTLFVIVIDTLKTIPCPKKESEYKLTELINIKIFSAINKYAGKSTLLDNMAVVVGEYLPYVFIAVLVYLWLNPRTNSKHSALFAGYSAIVGVLINRFITFFYFHPRPFMENVGTQLINHVPESSFPSDHATFMLVIASTLLFTKSTRIIGCILFFLGLLGGTSRVFCGVHFPHDIFGSLLVSGVTTYTIWALREKLIVINDFIISIYSRALSRKKHNTTIKQTVKS